MMPHKILQGRDVVLIPLSLEHIEALRLASEDGELWKLWYTSVPKPEDLESYVREAIEGGYAYAVYSQSKQLIIGTTRIYRINLQHKRAYIGHTWYAQSAQKTHINTEAKYLLLQFLFEEQDINVVRIYTHFMNFDSRRAIARLGAKEEGVLRNDMVMPDGSVRDSVLFSIIKSEWPTVKIHLNYKMAQQY